MSILPRVRLDQKMIQYRWLLAPVFAVACLLLAPVQSAVAQPYDDTEARNKFARCVRVKEEHAEKVKREVQIIWSDYFKPEHLTAYPDLHDKVWKLLKLAGKNKQSVDAEAASQLEAAVKEFGEIFWATKA